MTDYYSILSRAVASLDPNTTQGRAALFNRARTMMLDRIRDQETQWTQAEIDAEIERFEGAVSRIEAENTRRTNGAAPAWPPRRTTQQFAQESAAAVEQPSDRGGRRIGPRALLAAAVLLLGAGAGYLVLNRTPVPVVSGPQKLAPKEVAKEVASKRTSELIADDNEVAPGVDGGSTDAGFPYYLRRQAVYYRTTYAEGTLLVDRSQRFIYFVQPQARAVRYGIGVGGECAIGAGLQRITRKAEWPEWTPSPALLKRGSSPARVNGGPGNPLGARVLYFGDTAGIHGTNAPKSIGQAMTLGCFRLINDDVVDLDKRVTVGTGVVVMN